MIAKSKVSKKAIRSTKLKATLEASSAFLSDGLEPGGGFSLANDMLFPANGSTITLTLTLQYSDGRPASGISVSASSQPQNLTGANWRTVNGLVSRYQSQNPTGGSKLRQRIRQGTVRLQGKLDRSSGRTDSSGKVSFAVSAWHVCGGGANPAADKVTLNWSNGSRSTVVKCGVDGLIAVPSSASSGLMVKPGISGKHLHPNSIKALKAIGKAWKQTGGKPPGMPNHIMVTEGSLRWGGLIPPHLTHRFGGTGDVRPISTDGGPTAVGRSNYSRAGTKIIINYMKQTGATEIRFADNLPGVTNVDSSHSNHIHVSWLGNPNEPWLVDLKKIRTKLLS